MTIYRNSSALAAPAKPGPWAKTESKAELGKMVLHPGDTVHPTGQHQLSPQAEHIKPDVVTDGKCTAPTRPSC